MQPILFLVVILSTSLTQVSAAFAAAGSSDRSGQSNAPTNAPNEHTTPAVPLKSQSHSKISRDTRPETTSATTATTEPPRDQKLNTDKNSTNEVGFGAAESRERRKTARYFGYLHYSPLDLLIPNKYGLSLGTIRDADKTWELEYLRGSLSVPFLVKDLGSMTDQRLSLIGRSYFGGNSFNLSYGLSYFDFSLHLGDELLNRVTGGSYPSLDLVRVQSLGFNFALGNRWIWERKISFGVDWFSWSQPLYVFQKKTTFMDYASNQSDRDAVDTAIKIISYMPRFALFKLQLGILF